jgi:hypothetical protein
MKTIKKSTSKSPKGDGGVFEITKKSFPILFKSMFYRTRTLYLQKEHEKYFNNY